MRKGVRLSVRMIDALRLDDIEITYDVRPLGARDKSTSMASVVQLGKSRFRIQPNTFGILVVMVRNRSSDPFRALLRLQPSPQNQPHNVALDLSKRFAWTGMLQRALHPPLEADEVREAELGITALCEGDFEICATVEEIKVSRKAPIGAAAPKRRIWHARESCLIDAVD